MEEHDAGPRSESTTKDEERADREGLPVGPVGQRSTMQCLNIRGLALVSNRVKVQTLEDSLELENSIGIFLTETWLNDSVLDAEIQMEKYDIHRSDRSSRTRGGVAMYVRKELQCKKVFSYSNSVVETMIVKCKKLKSLLICVYRPPSTSNSDLSEALEALDEAIVMSQANGDYDTIVMGGDFNFPSIIWENNLPKISLNLNHQEDEVVNLLYKYSLMNYVNKQTRKENILDLILTNDPELIGNCRVNINSKYSDRNSVICDVNVGVTTSVSENKIMNYMTTVPNFNWINGSIEQW